MNEQNLGFRAKEFAQRYVVLVGQLKKEGVVDEEARETARRTALDMMFEPEGEGEPCPLCGR